MRIHKTKLISVLTFLAITSAAVGFSVPAASAAVKKKAKASKDSDSDAPATSSAKASKYDATGLKSAGPEVPAEATRQRRPVKKKNDSDPRGLLTSDSSDILETIRGINLLLKKNPEKNDKIKLLLNRSMATYSLARKRLLQSKSMKLDATSRKLLQVASNDAHTITVMNDISRSQKGRAYYIFGLTLIYLEKNNDARDAFIQALNINPKSPDAGWMALYIAEDLFDSEKYNEAIPFYSNYFEVMDDKEIAIAKYKSAWCYLNLKNERKAIDLFEDLIKRNPAEGFGRDSIKDLAYVLTTYSNEKEILDISERLFKKNAKQYKIEFLSAALSNYEIQNAVNLNSKILARLLELEEDPVKKLQFLLAGVRTTRREYASAAHYDSLIRVRNFVKEQNLDPGTKEMVAAKSSMETEAQNLIKSFVETFAGRTKTPEKNLTKDKISAALKNLFNFYDAYFSDAQAYPTILGLWLDVCMDTSDWNCADKIAQRILDRRDMKAKHGKVALDQLEALENLAKDPKNGAGERLIAKLEEFAKKQKGSEGWIDITNRLGEMYVKQKDFGKAIPLFQDVYDRQPTPEHFYRIQWARFESGDYQAIAEDNRVPKGKADPRTDDLRREAALKLALASRKTDNFKEYNQHIRQFLASNPAPDKAMAARKDWFSYMIEKDLNSDLSREMSKLPLDIRFSKDMTEILEQAWARAMKGGQFKEAVQLVSSSDKKFRPTQPNKVRRFLAALSAGTRPNPADLKELSGENRTYILGILALARPEWAISYLRDYEPLKGKELRTIGAVAIRMQSGEWNVSSTQRNQKLLGGNFSFSEAPANGLTPAEKMIQKVIIPTKALKSQATIGRFTQDIVYQTRKVRSRTTKDVKSFPLPVQIRSVRAAKELELKTANFIKSQPLPPGLTGPQVTDYEKGIADVVKEFTDAAEQFDKLAASLGDVQGQKAAEAEARYLPLPDLARWPWPTMYNSDAMQGLKSMVENHNFLAALFVVDLYRPKPLENNTDYYAIRSGILFSTKDTKALRRYVLEELEQTGQNDLIKVWKDIVGINSAAPASNEKGATPPPATKEAAPKEDQPNKPSGDSDGSEEDL